jgi:uncharacterized YccA/Bax inhibitor family protein
MSIFQSGNPTLTDKMFDKSRTIEGEMQGTMTVRGTMNKFGFLLLMLLGASFYTWNVYEQGNPTLLKTLWYVGMFGAMGIGILLNFKPNLSTYLAPVFAALEGLFVGGLSAVMNDAFSEKFPGLVITAVGLTLGVAVAMFLLYNFRIIKPTEKFKSIVSSAMLGIAIFYLINFVLSLFHINLPFMQFGNSSILGIGISLFVVAISALHLVLDFERIEQGAESNAPKFMEWYCGMGLIITLVWLYIELLRLLSRFSSKN